jgi:hypothetical protein
MRRGGLALVILAACVRTEATPPPSMPPRVAPVPSPARGEPMPVATAPEPAPAVQRTFESVESRAKIRELLVEPHRVTQRGIYRGGGAARLRPDGPPFAEHVDRRAGVPYDVVETRDDKARILVSRVGVTLLVWVDFADFEPQPREPVVLASAPERVPSADEGRLEIGPGERVEVLRTEGEWHEVGVVRRGVTGWLPAAAFAPVFPIAGFPVTRPGTAMTRGRTRVRDRPGGATIWRMAADVETTIEQEKRGWLRITAVAPCDDTWRVTGWVREKEIERLEPMHGGFGCGRVGVGEARADKNDGTIEVMLPDGTELFDETGQLVGRVRANNSLQRAPAGQLFVRTRWGSIPVFADVDATPVSP